MRARVTLALTLLLAACPSTTVQQVDVGGEADAGLLRDAGLPLLDSGSGDAAEPNPDAAEPNPDAAEPNPDAAEPNPDAAEPNPDAAAPNPDAAFPDAAVVDLTPPETTIDRAPPTLTASATLGFEFSSSEPGSTFRCALDGAATATCASPRLIAAADGAHVFTVAAIDLAGNEDPSPATASFTVDTIPPIVSIDSGPSGSITASVATFTFSASEPVSFRCSFDGDPAAPCGSPQRYSPLALGGHTFTVTATDAVQHPSAPVTRSFTVVPLIPNTTILTAPSALTNDPAARFTFSSDLVGSTFECRLDSPTFVACASPFLRTVAPGAHSFAVRAVLGGVADPTPATASFTLDTTPPAVAVSSPAQAATTGRNISVAYTAEAGATVRCAMDPAALAPCPASPVSYSNLSNGAHTFRIVATDAAGNASAPIARGFTVDAVGPVVTITALPGNTSTVRGHINYVANETATFSCTIDAVATPCSAAGVDYSLAPGSHTLLVHGTDGFGNVGANASYPFTAGVPTSVTIRSIGCSVLAGDTLVVQSPTGAVIGTAVTDLSGVAQTNLISDGDTLTAAYTQSGDTRLETIFDVRAGEAITLGQGTACFAATTGFTVRLPSLVPGATYYEVRYGPCVRSFTPAEVGTNVNVNGFTQCRQANGNYTLVARASSLSGVFQQSFLTEVAPGSTVTMPAWANRQQINTTFTNFPADVFTLDAEISARYDGVEVSTAQSRADATNPTAIPALMAGLAQVLRVYGEARVDAPSITSFTGLGFEIAPTTAVTIDLASRLPLIRSLSVNRSNQSRPSISYVSDAPIVADGGLLTLAWTVPTRGQWRFIFPSTTTIISAPALPASLASYLPTAASVFSTLNMELTDSAALAGWDAFQLEYNRYADGYPEGSSGASSGPTNTRNTSINVY